MWRRARGGVDKTKTVIVESFECFQHLKQHELRKMEKIDLAGGQSRTLELTGRTIMVGLDAVLCMEKIDAQCDG